MSAGADLAISSYLWLKKMTLSRRRWLGSALLIYFVLQPGFCGCRLALSPPKTCHSPYGPENVVSLKIDAGVIKLRILG